MADQTVSVTSGILWTPPFSPPNSGSSSFDIGASYNAQNVGQIDVPGGTLSGAILPIPFGTVTTAKVLIVKNMMSSDVGVRFNDSTSDSFQVAPGAVVGIFMPKSPVGNPVASASFVTKAVPGSTETLSFFVFGDGAGPSDAFDVASQPDWVVDPVNGNDGFSGVPGSPLKTLSEWVRRASSVDRLTASSMTVTILSSLNAGDYPMGVIRVGNCNLVIQGSPTPVQTGTYTTVVQCNPATNVPYSITDTALSSASFWSAHVSNTASVGRRLRTTSGPNVGNVVWPAKDLGAKSCRVSAPMVLDLDAGSFAATLGALTTGDPYVLEQIPMTNGMAVTFLTDQNEGASKGSSSFGQARVVFKDLGFPGIDQSLFTTPGVIRSNHDVADFCAQVAFFGCDVGAQIMAGSVYCCNCRFNYQEFSNGQSTIHAGLAAVQFGGIEYHAGSRSCSLDLRFLIQGSGLGPGLAIHGGSYPQFSSFGIFDCTHGIDMYNHGLELSTGLSSYEIFGSGNSGFGIRFISGAFGKFSSASGTRTLTGTSGDLRVGTVTRTWGQVPYVDSDISAGSGTKFTAFVSF